jgi:hypothetical protein
MSVRISEELAALLRMPVSEEVQEYYAALRSAFIPECALCRSGEFHRHWPPSGPFFSDVTEGPGTPAVKIHKRVVFHGEVFWLHDDGDGDVAYLCPLDHYDETGELTANPFRDISYAIIDGDEIWRHREVIGSVSELRDVVDL